MMNFILPLVFALVALVIFIPFLPSLEKQLDRSEHIHTEYQSDPSVEWTQNVKAIPILTSEDDFEEKMRQDCIALGLSDC